MNVPIRDLAATSGAAVWATFTALLAACALTGCGSQPSAPASSATPAAAGKAAANASAGTDTGKATNALAGIPKSVFKAGPKAGRDPFFPNSNHAMAQVADTMAAPRLPLFSYLRLVGIRPGPTRPLALINKTTFAPGEEASVAVDVPNHQSTTDVQKVNIRCLEIRKDSVLISIAGEHGVKELRIAQRR